MIKKFAVCITSLIFTFTVFTYCSAETQPQEPEIHAEQASENTDIGNAPSPDDIPVPLEGEAPQNGRTAGKMPQGNFPDMPQGERPQGAPPKQENIGSFPPDFPAEENTLNSNESVPGDDRNNIPAFGNGDGMFQNPFNEEVQTGTEAPPSPLQLLKTYSTPIFSVILLVLAFLFVIFYKRKNY